MNQSAKCSDSRVQGQPGTTRRSTEHHEPIDDHQNPNQYGRLTFPRNQPLPLLNYNTKFSFCLLIMLALAWVSTTNALAQAETAPEEAADLPTPGLGDQDEEGGQIEEATEPVSVEGDGEPLLIEPDPEMNEMGQVAPQEDPDELVNLNLNKQDVSEIIEFIVRWTGKVVLVQEQAILSRKITVMSEKKVPKSKALEILYQAFKLNDIAVVETEDMIMIDSINDVSSLQPGVVLGPEIDVEALDDDGNIVIKVFQIQEAKAQDIYDRLDPSKPEYARLTVDVNSNQIIVESDVGYAKRVARLIRILDVEPYVSVKVETFRLKYADATTVSELIETLFASSGNTASPQVNRTNSRTTGRNQSQRTTQNQAAVEVGTSEQLTVTVLEPTNSITVRAEPDILTEIQSLLDTAWDVPPAQEGDLFRIYDLRYTDPIKVKELLVALLQSGGTSSAGNARGNTRGNNAASGADAAVANIFKIEAYPDSNRLIVISKSPSNFGWLNEMIERIDMPLSVGMPINVELKHASAISVAEILNALLANSGATTSINAPDEGLSGIDFDAAGGSSGASNSTNTTGGSGTSDQTISFPWQSQRGGAGDESTEVSALVGKARVVPNASQNSLLVLATPEIQQAVLDIIDDLDRPGRQVMISAVLAEVELGDQFEFGLRFGQGLTPDDSENAVVITSGIEGTLDPVFPNSLTTSAFGFNVDATVILQALDQVTNTRILQSPRLFTSDNQEAVFFDGQDVPVSTGDATNSSGGITTSFDYRAVGIGVNVRPRITKEKNVAMQIEILLSNIDKNTIVAGADGNPVFKRRQTNTTITVKNGQTIVISGIRKEQEGKKTNKVPLLGDIPILDWVFSNTSDETTISELVVFITPIVVDNPDENDINFNEIERRRLETFKDPIGERMRNLQRQLGTSGNSPSGTPGTNSDPRRD